jgi:methylglutaconyl-CoA hydratase
MSQLVRYEVEGGVARVTLNRPEKRNALSAELIGQLHQIISDAGKNPDVRVIAIRGEGKDFCAGMDLAYLASTGHHEVMDHVATAQLLADLYLLMRRHPRPIVSIVHGRAVGGGAGLAMASDLVLATDTAEFWYPEVNLGFVAGIVSSQLRRVVSEKRAFEIIAMAEPIPAARALDWGMINRVWPEAEFAAQSEAFLNALTEKSATALTLTKDLMYHIDGMTFEAAMHAGLYSNAVARMTPDAKAGFDKFIKKKQ